MSLRWPSATASRISLPRFPLLWRSSTPRAWTRSCVVFGWRWAIPSTARSGRIWRTGTSTDIARRSRHSAHRPGHATGPRLEHADVLDPQPRLAGIGARRRPLAELLAGLGDPLRAAQLGELLVELVLQRQQMIDVGRGVVELLGRSAGGAASR